MLVKIQEDLCSIHSKIMFLIQSFEEVSIENTKTIDTFKKIIETFLKVIIAEQEIALKISSNTKQNKQVSHIINEKDIIIIRKFLDSYIKDKDKI